MAHLLAISGFHIAMNHGMLYLMIRKLSGFRGKLLEWVHFNYLIEVLVLVVLWGYLFLLNWPVPLFWATCMISILVLGYSLGHVQVPKFSLGLISFNFCYRNRLKFMNFPFNYPSWRFSSSSSSYLSTVPSPNLTN